MPPGELAGDRELRLRMVPCPRPETHAWRQGEVIDGRTGMSDRMATCSKAMGSMECTTTVHYR